MRQRSLVLFAALTAGLVSSCTDDLTATDGPSACIGGELCVGDLVCIDGLCVPPDTETGTGETGDGDDAPGDGDGDCSLGTEGCGCEPNEACFDDLQCIDDTCVPPTCGNGELDDGEACDDGNNDNNDACLNICELASCGDGYVGPGEACDDGNDIDDDECANECTLASCGDGITQEPEACDDGNVDDSDACLSICVNASCGDGHVRAGFEDCDDGNMFDDDACLSTCVEASCGDGHVHAGVEACDDANMSNTDACVSGCVAASCGDGYVQQGVEECDDANMSNTDTCVAGCQAASCGDGFVGPGEGCDDGNNVNNDACSNSCSLPGCGDGVVQPGEGCDDGNQDNTDACLSTCVAASCGDGWAWQGIEQCDDGDADNTDVCTNACLLPVCGDGFTFEGNEECDDGNMVNTDACLNGCILASCGDGFLQQGVEACDDGNMSNTDACLNTCAAAACGDGFVHQNVEDCDDQNGNNNDACLNTCDAASCGDGFLQQGVEACDQGVNNSNYDACTLACEAATCGDGLMWLGTEECDDGNLVANDGCDACTGESTLEITRGYYHSCLMGYDGSIRCWGDNAYGQLGIGSTTDIGDQPNEMPPATIDVGGVAVQLASGGYFNCALLVNGELRCWGRSDYGQLGQGNTASIGDGPGEMPPPVVNVGGQVAQVVAGFGHACVLLVNGQVRCWGRNDYGQLGQGHSLHRGDGPNEMPPSVANHGAGNVVQLAAGFSQVCVLLDTNKVRCWGYGIFGALGTGSITNIGDNFGEMPPIDIDVGAGTILKIGLSTYTGCALFDNGDLRCWGGNFSGQLGQGTSAAVGDEPGEMPPVNTNYGAGTISDVNGGLYYTQVLMADGSVRNWGAGEHLGYGSGLDLGDDPGEMPPNNVALGGVAIRLSKGVASNHACVVLENMRVRCWGNGNSGQLGSGGQGMVGDGPGEMPPVSVLVF